MAAGARLLVLVLFGAVLAACVASPAGVDARVVDASGERDSALDAPDASVADAAAPQRDGTTSIRCTPPGPLYRATYADVVVLVQTRCAGSRCHVGGQAGGLNMNAPVLHANTVGVASKNSPLLRIHPGQPQAPWRRETVLSRLEARLATAHGALQHRVLEDSTSSLRTAAYEHAVGRTLEAMELRGLQSSTRRPPAAGGGRARGRRA